MKLLLHVCCASCATIAIERLQGDWQLVLLFSNSNIFPKEEYIKRLEDTRKIASIFDLELIEDQYDEKDWLTYVHGLENEPERGKRCKKCIKYRLKRTASVAKDNDIRIFTTTLTTSPHKDAEYINTTGEEIGKTNEIKFLPLNLKKKDGFKRSVELSKQYNLYRQNYCGCRYSI